MLYPRIWKIIEEFDNYIQFSNTYINNLTSVSKGYNNHKITQHPKNAKNLAHKSPPSLKKLPTNIPAAKSFKIFPIIKTQLTSPNK